MNSKPVLDRRRAGVLLHPTSLPNGIGNGDLGADAHRFVDFLAQTGFTVWQMLPLGPTHDDASPYHSLSVHAANPLLIGLAPLAQSGWLERDDCLGASVDPTAHRCACLRKARQRFLARAGAEDRQALAAFVAAESAWLEDYALYQALRAEFQRAPWWTWSAGLRDRNAGALAAARERLTEALAQVRFEQFLFDRQWQLLRTHADEKGVLLFGDMPIFVAHDSVDIWVQREYFALDAEGQPTAMAGVPPDYFSREGQRWGNPLYDWGRMQADDFRWWTARLATELDRFDLVRVDHFRGFEACWEIPAADETAANGRWVQVPGAALFDTLLKHFGTLPLVAEDLGHITPAVHALRERYGFPGMRVLQFAFDGGTDNPYLPHNHSVNSVVYTGTHDNDTTLAWFQGLAPDGQQYVVDYLGHPGEPMPQPLLRAALASVARLAMLPMQDVLMLGPGHRMNTPGTAAGNWRWRFGWEQVHDGLAQRLRRLIRLYGRE